MELTVIEASADVSHVRLEGRMDPNGTQKIRERLRAETVGRDRPAVVDVSGVSFITSVGIGIIVDCIDSVRRAGHKVVLVTATGHVDDVMRKTGVYQIVATADSASEALKIAADSSAV